MNIPGWCANYVGLSYDEVSCFDLVKLVYKDVYSVEISGIREQGDLVKTGFWFEVNDDFQTGDILVFKDSSVKRHVGILLTHEHMLHADIDSGGAVIDRWVAGNWTPRLDSIYRCKQL